MKKPCVVLIDYGMGNILSAKRALEYCGAQVVMAESPETVEKAELLVLPGVGAFGDGMKGLKERNLIEAIRKYAFEARPFLGICLGMQMMTEESEEFGLHEGLGLIPGRVVPIPGKGADGLPHKIPHIGWNQLLKPSQSTHWENTALSEVKEGQSVYFVHSFMAVPADDKFRLADCDYDGVTIAAVIRRGNLYGCQFHPEKSGETGLKILRRFLSIGAHLREGVPG